MIVSDLRNINEALQLLMYVSAPRFAGVDVVRVTLDDGGNHGAGGALSDSESINVTVSAVNHAPSLNVSSRLLQLHEDGPANFSVRVADEDCADMATKLKPDTDAAQLGGLAAALAVPAADGRRVG